MDELPSQKQDSIGLMSILYRIGEVTTEDIESLQRIIMPKGLKIFEDLPKNKKMVWTLLYKISEDELFGLAKLSIGTKHMGGIHDLGGDLSSLYWCTNEEKFKKALDILSPDKSDTA